MNAKPPVTVVVPVYNGAGDVARCLDSVERWSAAPGRAVDLLVIDDASPEPAIRALLDERRRRPAVLPTRLARNAENLGFVRTVNRAFRECDGDVVVLNADTVVTEGWLTRLAEAADQPDVATVTPLSGFGSICTLPPAVVARFGLDGAEPDIEACAAFVSRCSLHLRPEVITGVGFCMYTTRRALDCVGLFDEDAFAAGYGEEVDLCLRAGRAGFRHLVEDATFVHHTGGRSFGETARAEGLARGSKVLHRRYPFFRAWNRRSRREGDLAVCLAALELGLAEREPHRRQVLHVLHSPPDELGGTEQHVTTLIESLLPDHDAAVVYPVANGFVARTIWSVGGERVEHEYHLPGGPRAVEKVDDENAAQAFALVLEVVEADAVHLQNPIGYSLAPFSVLEHFAGPVVCSVRDLYLGCPHHWLLHRNLQPCGLPEDRSLCATCLPETRGLPLTYLEQFRAAVASRLDAVDHWVFASTSAADFFRRVYDVPDERVAIIEHGALIDPDQRARDVDEGFVLDEPLRLGFVGLGWAKKGLDVVNHVADQLARTDIEVHHFGRLRGRASPNLRLHGEYDNAGLRARLDRAGVQVALLPAPFAETFGHVLTEVILAGRPAIGTSYGALGERIRRHQIGWTVDPEDPDAVVDLVRNLNQNRLEVLRAARATLDVPVVGVAATAPAYADLYRGAASRPFPNPASDRGEPVPDTEPLPAAEEVDRLRRHLRALSHVNRQLHAELAAAELELARRRPPPKEARDKAPERPGLPASRPEP